MGNITLNITDANATLHDHNFSVVECNYFGRVELEEVEVKGREVGLSRAFSDIELEELLKASPDYRSIAYLTAFHVFGRANWQSFGIYKPNLEIFYSSTQSSKGQNTSDNSS